jgi:hypothetical protein
VHHELEAILQQRPHHCARLFRRRTVGRLGGDVEAIGARPVRSAGMTNDPPAAPLLFALTEATSKAGSTAGCVCAVIAAAANNTAIRYRMHALMAGLQSKTRPTASSIQSAAWQS